MLNRFLDAGAAVLRMLPAEPAHRATLGLLRVAAPLLPSASADDPCLAVTALGLRFPNPLGLAAGFDKNADVAAAMAKLRFGFVELGTVTPLAQTGNPKPRLFRLEQDGAVINRMGFNSAGMAVVASRLQRRYGGVLGINIGANRDSADRRQDYKAAFVKLAPFADYIAVNVSSPNTPGLRALQDRNELESLLGQLAEARAAEGPRVPLLLKISPDITAATLDDIVAVSLASGIEGLIVSNTTIARPASLTSPVARESGGLSGRPLFGPSTELLRQARLRAGENLTLIGVGGISSGADAYAKIRAGATLVQLYTALAYQGPSLIGKIKSELFSLLARDRLALADAVGIDAR